MLDYVDVHYVAGGGSRAILTGDRRPSPPSGQLSHRTFALPFELAPGESVESFVESESVGEQTIKGFQRPVKVERVLGAKPALADVRLAPGFS